MTKGSSPTTMPEALSTPTTSTGSTDSTAAPTAPTAVTQVIASIRRVPDRYRSFTTSDAEAGGVHRIPATLLAELLDAGLPHRMSQGAVLLDRWDLDNIRMTLRLRSPQRTAIGRMAEALEAGARAAELRRKVHIVGRCPEPGHEGDCGFELAPEARACAEAVECTVPHHHRAEVRLPGGPPTYFDLDGSGGGLRMLFDAAGELAFHFLPEELSEDLGFLRETGLANCYSAGRHLVALGTEAGLALRPAFGLFVSPPFSNRHAWIEIAVDGRRLPADPFFVRTLTEWGLLDPQAWPPHRAPLGVLWRYAPTKTFLMRHQGTGIRTSLLTQ